MFKPEAYVDSVLDLLDDEQTLVAENIIKNPLDMQERYMSLVPDGLLDFIVKQWRPGMTSDQADKIFRKYSSFNQGGSVDFKVIGTPGGKVKPGIKYYGDNIVTPIKQGEHAGEYHLRLGGGDREVFYGSKDELEKVLSDYKLKVRQRTDIDVDLVKKLIEDANKGDKFKSPIDISDEYNKIKKTNIRLSGKTKDSPVYDILSTLESQDEKINKVFDSLLTSDQPVNFSFYEALPKDRRGETVANPWRSEIAGRTGIEQAKIKRVLNKNKDYLTNKNFFDYISKSKLGTAELKDLPLNFQIEYAKEAVKGRPRFTGLDGQTNLTRDPNYKIMEFARRSWDNTKGKGQIKFFDKNGKLIEWKYGSTLPYKDVSFSYKGKNFGLNDLKQPGFSKKFFPEVVAKQEAINNLLVEEVYNPIRKKTTSFKQLANDVQVKGYGWEKRAGVMDILHGEKGVTGEPFTNLRYNSRDINLLENGLYSSFKAGKISEANYKLALNNLNKVFDEASPEEVSTLIKNRINTQAGKIVDNDFYGFDKFKDKTMTTPEGKLDQKNVPESESKKIAQNLRKAGFKCKFDKGGLALCDNPADYAEDITRQAKLAADKNPAAINKFKNAGNIVRKGISGLSKTGVAAIGELLFAFPFAVMDYTDGLSFQRIIGNVTLGLFGQTEDSEIRSYSGGYQALKAKDFEQKSTNLQDIMNKEAEVSAGNIMLSPDDINLLPSQVEGAEKRFIKAFDYYSGPDGYKRFLKDFDNEQKIREEIQKKNLQRSLEREKNVQKSLEGVEPISAFAAASGGLANLTTTIPPKRGPNSQGLASLKKYGKQY
jgi:hypothetical protein